MYCRAGSRRVWAASGSRSRISSVEPLRSANSTVTCLRSPSRCLFHKYIASHRRHAVGAQHAAPLLPEGSIDTLESCPEVAHCAPPPRGLYTGAGLTKWTSSAVPGAEHAQSFCARDRTGASPSLGWRRLSEERGVEQRRAKLLAWRCAHAVSLKEGKHAQKRQG